MNLEGARIVIDAFNLDLPEGTGIKTYATTLISALQRLQAEVGVLHARNVRDFVRPYSKRDRILNEMLFFDGIGQQSSAGGSARLHAALTMVRGVLRWPCRAHAFNFGNNRTIPSPSDRILNRILNGVHRYNQIQCFENALRAFRLTHRDLPVAVPDRVDVWHATYMLPVSIKGAKRITTIHDCVPFLLPWSTLDRKKHLYELYRHVIRQSDLIVTVSENSKADILELFDVEPDSVQVTYQPVHIRPLSPEEDHLLDLVLERRYDLRVGGYVLFVGAIEPKKNVGKLIDAYLRVNTDLLLIIAGRKAWLWEKEIGDWEAGTEKLKKRVRFLGHVSNNDLRYLYAGALCLVFPSLYEGFGLPPLEAMTLGTPVVTSNVSSLPEICGDAAQYVDPYDTLSIMSGLEKVISDQKLRDRLRLAGQKRAAEFSMENYLERLGGVYSRLL